MRDRSDRYQIHTAPPLSKPKRLGGYLLEAGLLTPNQIDVALNDQRATGMKFGEILVARGWVKEQTIEWVMEKVAKPERKAFEEWEKRVAEQDLTMQQAGMIKRQPPGRRPMTPPPEHPRQIALGSGSSVNRREIPITKPLPPIGPSDGDVSWVG